MDETLICPYCGQEQYGHEPRRNYGFHVLYSV